MRSERGYAMAALLVGMSVMAIMMSVALPVWRTAAQREREAELVFRGEQYARAIDIFQRRTGGYPQTLDVLEKTRAIRRLYKDPMTGGEFQPVFVGQMIGGAPVVPGQAAGRGGRAAGAQPARDGAGTPTARGAGEGGLARGGAPQGGAPRGGPGAAASPVTGRGAGQTGFGAGQTPAAGPIIGVVSRSTGTSLRLYNGRGKYNEWAFVATATTQQAGGVGGPAGGVGGPAGVQTPGQGPRGPRGRNPGLENPRGRNPGFPRGQNPGPRGMPFPGRGIQPPGGRGGGQGFPGPGTNPRP
jgi:type II secretory pathway pseudopilin PulG